MTTKKASSIYRLILLALVAGSMLVVCGDSRDTEVADLPEGVTDSMLIEEAMKSTLMRWAHRDKGGMYEMEWEYIQDSLPFDQYLEHWRIKRAFVDSLIGYKVTSVELFGRDSAMVEDELTWLGPSGDTTVMPNKNLIYFHRGRWIRPTLGSIHGQRAYEERIRQADSAATAEEEEGYDY